VGALDYLWIGLAGGAASFAHCMGMCGAFALHLSGPASADPAEAGRARRGALARQLLWHAGRISTYVFLGTLAGFFGGFVGSIRRWAWAADLLAYGAGAVMIVMGLKVLGLLPVGVFQKKEKIQKQKKQRGQDALVTRGQDVRDTHGRDAHDTILSGAFGALLSNPTAGGAFALGLAGGFLPCPVVIAFLALCVQSRSVPIGMGTMAAMGIGTVWSLALVGAAGGAARAGLRRWGPQVGGAVLLLLGLTTTLRGSDAFHRLMGCPIAGTGQTSSQCSSCEGVPNQAPGDAHCSRTGLASSQAASQPRCHGPTSAEDRANPGGAQPCTQCGAVAPQPAPPSEEPP
jgi:sulfite exporter TauE/SafE